MTSPSELTLSEKQHHFDDLCALITPTLTRDLRERGASEILWNRRVRVHNTAFRKKLIKIKSAATTGSGGN